MQNYDERLLEPTKYYNDFLRDFFRDETVKYFESLVKKSNVNIEENKKTVAEYTTLYNEAQSIEKRRKWNSIGLVTSSLMMILCLVFEIVYLFLDQTVKSDLESFFLLALCALFVFIGGVYFFNKKVKDLTKILNEKEKIVEEKKNKAYSEMNALNSLFHREMTHQLVRKVIPFINLDYNFDMKRFEELVTLYNLREVKGDDYSTLDLLSGDILGNPFLFVKELYHYVGMHRYTGTRVVSYVVYSVDSEGKRQSRTVHETLYANVEKPGPYYSVDISLIYGNDAAPNLTFSRVPVSGRDNTFSLFNIKKNISKLRKKTADGTLQGMANEEFDASFNAQNRDNEVEFRLLFTPLAQQNFKEIFENSPYGDDFIFRKNKKLNEISATHMRAWDLNTDPYQYIDFSFERIKEKFIDFNCSFFDHMFCAFIPLLSIPLYQQMKAKKYIYKSRYRNKYNSYVTEMLANLMDVRLFRPKGAGISDKIRTMLKTSVVKNEDDGDIVEVRAKSYYTKGHVEYVPVIAGNGNVYPVAVHWLEYIPIEAKSHIKVKGVDTNSTENDIIRIANECDLRKNNGRKVFKDYLVAEYK